MFRAIIPIFLAGAGVSNAFWVAGFGFWRAAIMCGALSGLILVMVGAAGRRVS